MKKCDDYPTPFAGVSLGVLGISAFWGGLQYGAIIACALLFPILVKFIRQPRCLIDDLRHPTVGSVVPTLAMSMMLISHAIYPIASVFTIILWSLAVCAHIGFFVVFMYCRLRNWRLDHIVPSWFVPPIGIVVACLTVPAQSLMLYAHIILYFGIISYAIMLPTMLYRLSLGGKVEDMRKPTLAVLAAPASLTLAGYLTLITVPNTLLVLMLFSIAIVMTISVYLMLFHMLKLPFSPAYAAFTFPLAISATAMMKMSYWSTQHALFHSYSQYFYTAAIIEGILSTLVIGYVLLLTIKYIMTEQLEVMVRKQPSY